MSETHDRLESGTATISGDPSFDDGPWTVHGVAQAAEVTQGVSGERRYWPRETLEQAADELVGTPIVDPDDHRDLEASQPHPDFVIGEVTDAAFEPGEGLLFEGELDDPERAKQIARGRVDVSPSVALQPGPEDPERDAQRVDRVVGYRDLAVVTDGAHASASIDLGMAEALAEHFDATVEAGTGDDGPNDEAGDGEGPSTPDAATDADADVDVEADADSQTTNDADWRTAMSDDELTDEERELLAAAGQMDDPMVVETASHERLSDHEELIDEYEALESPTLVEEDDHEMLQAHVDTVEAMMVDALQERTGLSDQAIEAMPFEALAAEFETSEGDLDLEALTQSPEASGGPAPSDDDDGVDDDALERIAAIDTKLNHLGSALPDKRVEALRDEAADLAGTDDYEAALEVL